MKTYRNPQDVHLPLVAYTHQIEITGDERMLVFSGQVGIKEDGTVPDDPIEQFDVAFTNVLRNLHAAEMDVSDIVKLTFYLVGEMEFEQRSKVIAAKLGEHKPCMTLLFVAALGNPIYKVEIDAWASKALSR